VRKVRWKTEEDFIGRYLARRNTSDQVEWIWRVNYLIVVEFIIACKDEQLLKVKAFTRSLLWQDARGGLRGRSHVL
jgi:hypothetical protein